MSQVEECIIEHIPLVYMVAKRLASKCNCNSEAFHENVSAGFLGLVEAAKRYDFSRSEEIPFKAFAFLRIRGAIIDSIGKSSYLTRKVFHSRNSASSNKGLTFVGEEALECVPCDRADASEVLARKQLMSVLNSSARSLTSDELELLRRHYNDEESLTSIAGGTEKRSVACKAHKKALLKLKKALSARWRERSEFDTGEISAYLIQ